MVGFPTTDETTKPVCLFCIIFVSMRGGSHSQFSLQAAFVEYYFLCEKAAVELGGEDRLHDALERYRQAVTNLPFQRDKEKERRSEIIEMLLSLRAPDQATSALQGLLEFNPDERADRLAAKATHTPSYLDKSCYVQTQMQRVTPGVFIGSFHPASDRTALRSAGVTHVCCCIGVQPRFPSDFQYLTLPADDQPHFDISQFFDATFRFIDDGVRCGGGVLVHCGAGISRAPTILAAYYIRKMQIPAVAAMQLIRGARSCASPNRGFVQQLVEYEKKILRAHS